MGLKRPFDAEEMQECNAKHARQLSYSDKLIQLDQGVPYGPYLEESCVGAEVLSDLCGSDCENGVEGHPTWTEDAIHVEKDFKTCVPVPWIQTGSCQEDSQFEAMTQSSFSHESSSSDFSWRSLSPVDDVYTCLMELSPRKTVPVGPNHQADIPEYIKEEAFDQTNTTLERQIIGDEEKKLMGECIISIPDSELCGSEVCKAGEGRKECMCLDKGSIRCVRRHIMENREDLAETVGYERLVKLGLCEMGEEVASTWTEGDEDLFHKVVYSNPASLKRDFWKQLKATFPSRTMKELVSYYFNVFILRRRAAQNRFKSLDVDSDDDEWQVEYDIFYSNKDLDKEKEKNLSLEDNEEETNSSEDDETMVTEEESPINHDGHCVYAGKASRNGGEVVNVEDDSCTSFELQDTNMIFSQIPLENREKLDNGNYWRHRSDGCGGEDLVHHHHTYPFEACDGRVPDCWTKKNDLLPTSNIIEEIFGVDSTEDDDNSLRVSK